MTEAQIRQKVVSVIEGWIGCKESDGSHKKILDVYNSHSPLPRGVKMLSTYAWCAATVSAAFIKAGLTDIGFVECSCSKMIALYKAKGRWKEADDHKPSPGDLMMYDWDDSGNGENTGAPEHVGMVVSVSGSTIKVIEGNKNDAVGYRTMKVNGRYIRGYCLPDYASKATKEAVKETASKVKLDAAKSFDKSLSKTWTATANGLNMRAGAGTNKPIITTLKKGTKFRCYGYYTKMSDGSIWLYGIADGKTGFCTKKYLG